MFQCKTLTHIAMVLTALSTVATASAQQMVHPTGDVFDIPPKAASAKGKPSCEPAQKYVDNINSGRYGEQGALFADDAVFLTPLSGRVLHGSAEIGEFYKSYVGRLVPTLIPISFIADGPDCIMELAGVTKLGGEVKYRLQAIDHFTINKAGKFQLMLVYIRPDSIVAQKVAQ